MQPGQGLHRRVEDDRPEAFGLGGRGDDAPHDLLDRVGVVVPGHGATHEVADDLDGEPGAVELAAGPGTADPRLGRGLGDAAAQGVVPAELGAGLAGGVDLLGDAGQRRRGR